LANISKIKLPNSETIYDIVGKVMTGASASQDGALGSVPKPVSGDQVKLLRGDGTWQDVSNLPVVSVSTKTIAAGSTTTTVSFTGTFVSASAVDSNNNEVVIERQINADNVVFTLGAAISGAITCKVMATSVSVADVNERKC